MEKLTELLLEERRLLNEERQELRERMSKAENRLREVKVRLAHVEGLLGPSQASESTSGEGLSSRNRDIRDIAADILGEREGAPLHYKDLAKEVQKRGGKLTGPNAPNILVARLVSDDRFVRPTRRGFYALRRDYPGLESVGSRGKRGNSDGGSEQDISSASMDLPM